MANMAAARIRLIETLVVIGLMLDLIVGSFKKESYAELRYIESKKDYASWLFPSTYTNQLVK